MKFGISFTATFFNQAGALVLVYRDGSVQVNHGGTEMGQGLYTKIRQIAADSLGVRCEQVRMMPTRTDKVPNTSATAASAGTDLNGAAVLDACAQIRPRSRRSRPRCWSATPRRCASTEGRRRRRRVGLVCRALRSGVPAAHAAVRAGLLPHARNPLRSGDRPRQAVPLLRVRRGGVAKSRSTASPGSTALLRTDILRMSANRSRRSSIAGRSKAGSCRASAG